MNCQDVRVLLHAYLDDELDAVDSLAVARHLAECDACKQRLDAYAQLGVNLRQAHLYRAAPAALRARVAARLPRHADTSRAPRQRWQMALDALAALFVIAAVFAGWQTLQLRRQGSDTLVAEAVSDHVRSLLPGHLIDVRTSKEHTVKPWFDGRADFSPQVKDLTAQGFELIGGRLDVLDGKQVAALVYKRHLHEINLFQWPAPEAAAIRTQTRDGYHVLEWSDAGLHFVTVSSIAESDLEAFAQAFRSAPAAARESAH
ncbi:MAG TPA: anti-sigma factor [Rhodanobacteraceae bacterium]|nr:anti-sigma factor [Rhodanobacteraceae bacterium]